MTPERIAEILSRLPTLPDTAAIPVPAVAVHDGVDKKTVYRNYPLVDLSPGRKGVLVGYLRKRRAA
jgi:hypothetical protein